MIWRIQALEGKRKAFAIAVLVMAALVLLVIWGNSMLPPEQSSKMSSEVKQIIEEVTGIQVEEHTVRKSAHFAEFAALGAEVVIFLWLINFVRTRTVVYSIFCGMTAALTDESIQLLSGRGALVQDVLLDLWGFALGAALVLLLYFLKETARPYPRSRKKEQASASLEHKLTGAETGTK